MNKQQEKAYKILRAFNLIDCTFLFNSLTIQKTDKNGFLRNLNQEETNIIIEFEILNNATVFHAIEMEPDLLALLYISDRQDAELIKQQAEQIGNNGGEMLIYIINLNEPGASSSAKAYIKPHRYGGLTAYV